MVPKLQASPDVACRNGTVSPENGPHGSETAGITRRCLQKRNRKPVRRADQRTRGRGTSRSYCPHIVQKPPQFCPMHLVWIPPFWIREGLPKTLFATVDILPAAPASTEVRGVWR